MKQTGLRDSVLTLAGIALLLALLRESSDIVVPFLFSLFITIIAVTPLNWLKQRGVSYPRADGSSAFGKSET